MSDLRGRIGRAFVAQGWTSLLGKGSNVVLTIVLARILAPEDFGLFTIALVVTTFANMLSNFGFQSYVIQASELSRKELDACFTLNIALSALLGCVVAVVAWAWVDPPPLLREMLQIYGLQIFVSGLSYIPLALLKRDLDFKRSSRAELANTIVSQGGRVAFAWMGAGALCFPLGDVLGAICCWLMVRAYSPEPRRLVIPRRKDAASAIGFGIHSTSVALASFFANQSDKLLLSFAYPMATVGLYGFAGNIAGMFYRAFIAPQSSVFLASFSRLRSDTQEILAFLHKSTRFVFSFSLPVCVPLILEAERILGVLVGAKWTAAADLVRIFAVGFLMRSMVSGITGLQLAFGLASAAARTKWTNAAVFVLLLGMAVMLKVGIIGYALAYLLADILTTWHNVMVNGRLVSLHPVSFLGNQLAPAGIAAASSIAWYAVREATLALPAAVGLAASAGTWMVAYVVLSLVFNRAVGDMVQDRVRLLRGKRA
jgi:PST family polysaccharide transporter